jgi:SET domain-containing protein
MPLLDGLVVVASKIHGYGVVTTRRFAKGELVCFGDGVLYTADADFDDTYALILPGEDSGMGEVLFWDLVCQSRWLNHSCEPNSEVLSRWDHDARTMRAWWVALRAIEIGEEITYDYAFAGEVAEPCACGAARCRGLIVDDEDPENVAKVPEHLRAYLRGAARAAS